MIVAGTGHRPDKLGGYNPTVQRALEHFALAVLTQKRPLGVISGMALGWDQALAIAAVRLGIGFVAAIPFEGQEKRWPASSQAAYNTLLKAASMVHVVTDRAAVSAHPGGIAGVMQARNEWMVDQSQGVLALWNGDRSGGTFNCVQYAKAGRREVINVWPLWDEWFNGGLYLV